jgi:hypothetical protein
MDDARTLKTLQLFYAAALVDAVRNYARQGVLEAVTASKAREQELSAPEQLARLGITRPEGIFSTFSSLFGCADWKVEAEGSGVRAETRTCLACALAKKLGSPSPCAISCINPLAGMARALDPPLELKVERSLWEAESCVFAMAPATR